MQTINRSVAPKIGLPSDLQLPHVEKGQLQNGLPVYTINGTSEPVIQLNIVLEAGRYFEHNKMVAAVTAFMMNKGTKSKTANEIASTIDFHGGSLKFQANMYLATVTLNCLKNQFPKLLNLLHEIFTEPTFPAQELNILITRLKQKLKVNMEKSNFIASQHFNSAVYGENHAFGYFTKIEDLDALTNQDLFKHYTSFFTFNQNSYLVLAGDSGKEEMELLNKYFGSLPVVPALNNSVHPQPSNTEFYKEIHQDDNVQASIRIGGLSLDFHHPDFTDLNTLNTVLGGYFGSRLMSNIREDKGYTYGIYSFINPIMDSSYFCISTDVGIQYKDATISEISKEIKRLQEEPIGEEELTMVKNYLIGQLMKSVDGPLKMSSTLKNLLIFGVREQSLNEQFKAIQTVQPERLMALAQQYLDFEKMYKIIAA